MLNTLKTLAMDTAAPVGSVALLAGTQLLARACFQEAAGHVVCLPVHLAQLLEQVAYSCADLDLIAVTIGPGSFAGVRIALGCAKGMALVHHTPVVGVSNLELLAAGTGRQHGWVAVVIDARRGEIFAALYRLEHGVPVAHLEPGVAHSPAQWAATLAALPELCATTVCLTGSGLQTYTPLFQAALGERLVMTPEVTWAADPFVLGLLGQKIWQQQQRLATPTVLLEPLSVDLERRIDYQRRPEAEEKKTGKICVPGP